MEKDKTESNIRYNNNDINEGCGLYGQSHIAHDG